MTRLLGLAAALCLLTACAAPPAKVEAATPEYGYQVVQALPHDPKAFTQGLFYKDGAFYESTGQHGQSSIRKVDPATGRVLQIQPLDQQYFGEGIIDAGDRIVQLTWRHEVGFIYGLGDFKPQGRFTYAGEGWGLTRDDRRLFMSDGTADIRILDPKTLQETGRIHVTDAAGRPVDQLNELEWVKGEIYANIWQTDLIARIDPASGKVTGWINLSGLLPDTDRAGADVLNGIAYDAVADRLFVTGKLWPKMFEIKLTPPAKP
ncbi:glutaminyl-peptide cyclotransferase [Caulobacter sp. NIBR2454]|uniref:glutaminyl-peptide cyclotransferase n=1 Tax=Caulobacter sp. NIBR2454 TaxID=3015996 RepID=UPI0022B748C6|nr:glutaminyl-peptide cyclotransferase [Caulobacter sp. NIBR2454]